MAAQHTQQENTGSAMSMEDQEEEEHHRHRRGDRPLLPVYAQEQQDVKPLPLSAKSRSMRSRGENGPDEASGSGGIRSLSFSMMFSFGIAASSIVVDIDQLAAAAAEDACAEQPKRQQPNPVCRSQSMPMTSIRRLPHSHRKRVADSSSLPRFWVSSMPVAAPESSSSSPPSEAQEGAMKEDEEEVGEEEAVCRICMVALGEGGNVLKLECRCKGELALAHRDCALKWFSIKGNANCDVCGHDVLNLPVTLRRVGNNAPPPLPPSPAAADNGDGSGTGSGNGFRGVWRHHTTILVVVSMLAYFCFLEQLLVGDHGAAAALAVSLPFAGVLGLFSALTTAKMVSRKYVWVYSAAQFLFIVLFTHLFYRYVHLQAVIAIILSTFAGFGVAICANAVLLQIIRWRARRPLTPSSDLQAALP